MNIRKTLTTTTILAALIGGLALVRAKNAQAAEDSCFDSSVSGEPIGTSGCSCEAMEECPGGLSHILGYAYNNASPNGAYVVVAANYGHETGLVRGYSYCTNAPIPTNYVKNYTSWISEGTASVSGCFAAGYTRTGVGCEAVMSDCP